MKRIEPLAKLIEHFKALPGIGNKTAVRLAYHVLDMEPAKARELAAAIVNAKEKIGYCHICFNLSDEDPCRICQAAGRDHSQICVVEQPQDVDAVERMRDFKGVYHVLMKKRESMTEFIMCFMERCLLWRGLARIISVLRNCWPECRTVG